MNRRSFPAALMAWRFLAVAPLLALALSRPRSVVSAPAPAWDTFSDTWVATDALGRALPTYDEVGPPKTNKHAGIFYFLWMNGGTVYDITQVLAANPTNPPWGPRWAFHHWGRPLFDYYRSNDRYVHRKHAQMLADAGIDALFFDVSNGPTYDTARQALGEELEAFRLSGHRVPTLSFLTHSSASNVVQALYDSFYARNAFPELWLRWKGRPLMLARASEMSDALRGFFNFRYSWAWDPGQDKWPWLDNYPQGFGWHESSGVAEEIPVCVAQHPTSNIGRSFHGGAEPSPDQRDPNVGLCFAEQWSRTLQVSAEMTFITGWNEWIAQRFVAGQDGNPSFLGAPTTNGQSYFVDQYNQEFSRDIEPMAGGHGDNYYYQMISSLRRVKGARPIEAVKSWPIALDGSFDDWALVQPEFRDQTGDPARRNHPGYDSAVTLVNTSGRNDLVLAKVSADATNVHFYVRTRAPLTPPGTNWMLLFIDADTNPLTGWLGYDLVVNRSGVTGTNTLLERNVGGAYQWGNAVAVPLRFAGNELELGIPRAALGGSNTVDFKWADNILQTGDWSDFTLNGDAAPNDRFNYRAKLTVGSYTLIPAGSSWRYNDTGANLGSAWRTPAYNDSTWPIGPAQLGFGDGDEATLLASNRQVTTYFRQVFHVPDAAVFTNLAVRLLRDDGAVLYLNGTEFWRANVPAGAIAATTLASTAVGGADEYRYFETNLGAAALVSGTNLLAVELHQSATNSTDLSFDLELLGSGTAPFALALTTPRDGQTLATNHLALAAAVSRPATVEFFVNGRLFAALTSPPYAVTWPVVPAGTYTITARATDGSGRRAFSQAATVAVAPGPEPLVASGSVWKFNDTGLNLGSAWRALSFNDAAWRSGPAQLGFGDGDEATLVASNSQVTTYFRHRFEVPDPVRFTNLALRLLRDDGAVVWLNNQEIWRNNLPVSGGIAYSTLALTAIGGADESVWWTTNASPARLVAGTNVLAVEIHQSSTTSSDISFDFALAAEVGPSPAPSLRASLEDGGVAIAWPWPAFGYALEGVPSLGAGTWVAVTNEAVMTNGTWSVRLPVTQPTRFFRLRSS